MLVIGSLNGRIVTHAMWVTRWLQAGDAPPMRTAYVEMVATEPALERRGFATAALTRVVEEVDDYDLAALWPNYPEFYARLGWSLAWTAVYPPRGLDDGDA